VTGNGEWDFAPAALEWYENPVGFRDFARHGRHIARSAGAAMKDYRQWPEFAYSRTYIESDSRFRTSK